MIGKLVINELEKERLLFSLRCFLKFTSRKQEYISLKFSKLLPEFKQSACAIYRSTKPQKVT